MSESVICLLGVKVGASAPVVVVAKVFDQVVVHRDKHCSCLPVCYANGLSIFNSRKQLVKVALPLLSRVERDVLRCRQLLQVR
jgi:hypothetical protein